MAERRYYTVTFSIDLDDDEDRKHLEDEITSLLDREVAEDVDIESTNVA